MSEQDIQIAREIFSRHPRTWTSQDNKTLFGMFKKGHRNALKTLRNQVLLEE